MRIHRPFLILLALIVIACLSWAQGQNSTTTSLGTSNTASQNAEYYTMPDVSAPSTHISAPVQIDILGKTLTTLYLGMQRVPYSQYPPNTNDAGGNSLWIQGTPNWMQYAQVPQGSTVSLMAVSPAGGSGYLSEMLNGTTYNSSFYFYRNSQLTFYADAIGQHTLSFNINGQLSNQATINVIAFEPTQNYIVPYNYMTPNYYGYSGYRHSSYMFRGHWPRSYGGRYFFGTNYPWLNAP